MLKVMRDSFHHLKWVLLAVVAAFVFGFVFLDMGLRGAIGADDKASGNYAARVNGETISLRDYDRALAITEQNYRQMYGQQFTPEMMTAMGINRQVLDSLIDQRLLMQEARRLDMAARPEEIRKRILAIPTLNPEGKFIGQEYYARFVTQYGYQSPAEFEEDLGRQITIDKMESAIENSIIVSPKAAETEYRRATENARIKYVLYPATKDLALVTVTPAEAEAYYKQNQGKYAHAEQRSMKYLLADAGRIRTQIVPSDAELRRRYDSNRETYKRPESARILHILIKVPQGAAADVDAAARAKANSIVQQLRGGADFAALAKANSGDPSSSNNGGDMGYIDRGMTVEAFDTAAFTIPLNTISDPIRTPEYGYHIIKVLDRKAAGYRTFEEVKNELSGQVAEQMAKDQAREELTRILARLRESKPKNAEEFSRLANDKVSSNDTKWFQKADPIPGLGANQPLSTWAFSAKPGDVGEIIGTSRGPVIPYLDAIRPAGVSSFAEIKEQVEADAKAAKARELARKSLEAAMAGAANVDAVAQKVGLPAAETTVNRQGFIAGMSGDTSALVDAAMGANVGDLKGPIVVGDGAMVIQVLEQKKVDAKEAAANAAQYLTTLRQQESRSLKSVLLQKLRKASKVEVNERVVSKQNAPQQQGV